LEHVLDLELDAVHARLGASEVAGGVQVEFRCTAGARAHLLAEGADLKYGARHLKRAIERRLVTPLASLIATHQVGGADKIKVDYDSSINGLVFSREAIAVARSSAAR